MPFIIILILVRLIQINPNTICITLKFMSSSKINYHPASACCTYAPVPPFSILTTAANLSIASITVVGGVPFQSVGSMTE